MPLAVLRLGFSPPAPFLSVSAALLAAVQFESLQARLPDVATFLAASNLVWLAVALACAKCLHDWGTP